MSEEKWYEGWWVLVILALILILIWYFRVPILTLFKVKEVISKVG